MILLWSALLVAVSAQEPAHESASHEAEGYEPAPVRTEWIGYPVFAQTPDLGLMLGVGGGVAHFNDQKDYPYDWSLHTSAVVSFREFEGRFRLLMQRYFFGLDLPQRFHKRLRFLPFAAYVRVPNAAYYGIGNAWQHATAPADDSTYFRYDLHVFQIFVPVRYHIEGPWSLTGAISYRFTDIDTYEGSLLEAHVEGLTDPDGDHIIPGLDQDHEVLTSFGGLYDTRDWELDPNDGLFIVLSGRHTRGIVNGTNGYSGFNLDARGFKSIILDHLVVGGRLMADVLVGDVAFYEFDHAGAFPPESQIGGVKGVRGIQDGRYRGQSKVLGVLEVRSWIIGHLFLGTHVRGGLAAFFDAGRVWGVTGRRSEELDGAGLGLRYGTGAGIRLAWGKFGIVRFDLAWSPFAPPNRPLSFYVDAGHSF